MIAGNLEQYIFTTRSLTATTQNQALGSREWQNIIGFRLRANMSWKNEQIGVHVFPELSMETIHQINKNLGQADNSDI